MIKNRGDDFVQISKVLTLAGALSLALVACSETATPETKPAVTADARTSATGVPAKVPATTAPVVVPAGYKMADHASFSLVIPDSWTTRPNTETSGVVFQAGSEDGTNVNMVITPVPSSVTAAQVADASVGNMADVLGADATSVRSKTTLPTGDVEIIAYTATISGQKVTLTQYVWVRNKIAFAFTTTSREGTNADTFKVITQSVRFK